MARFRYDTTGNWYKGNTHLHSIASDGRDSSQQLWETYAAGGYHFLFHTDHGVASSFRRGKAAAGAPLLVLDGIEINGRDRTGGEYHVVCLGSFRGIRPGMEFVAAMAAARRQRGLLILAHPHWTGNSQADALRHGFDGVEVYNHVCWWLNGKGDGSTYWDQMLGRQPDTLGFAADDTHSTVGHGGTGGGWTVANAKECTPRAILRAIRRGNFYSSRGPEFHSIESDGRWIRFRTSAVKIAHLVGPGYRGLVREAAEGETLTEHEWEIPADWRYARLQVEDAQGRRAWTNTLFFDGARPAPRSGG